MSKDDEARLRTSAARRVLALSLGLVLGGCGGGGGGGGDDPVGGQVDEQGGTGGGDSSLSEGAAPDAPLSDAAARALGIDVMELNDALHFLATILPADVALPDGACEGGGTRTPSEGERGRSVTFADCASSANAAVRLDGRATLVSEEADPGTSRLELDGWSVRSAARTVSVDGTLLVSDDGGGVSLTLADAPLNVDDSQGELVITGLDARVPAAGETGEDSGEATFAYTVDSSRAGESATVSTVAPLAIEDTVGCPTDGAIALTFDDSRTLRLTGAPGGNVGVSGDFGDDTLACSEIGRLIPAASIFTPPPVPGN